MKKVTVSRGSEVDVEKCVRALGGNRYTAMLAAADHARQMARDDPGVLPSAVSALLDIQDKGISGREV
jgi:DNA-directed RNA polymerase subunit K/omega